MNAIEFILVWAWVPLGIAWVCLMVYAVYIAIRYGPPPYDPDPTSVDWINNFPWGAL